MASTAIKTVSYPKTTVNPQDHKTKIVDNKHSSTIKRVDFSKTHINPKDITSEVFEKSNNSNVIEMLPFRVRFKTIGISGYSSNNPAPIGIAIIGLNNYIL